MIDLEHALADLADHLDYRARADAPAELRRRLGAPASLRRVRRRGRAVAAIAAAIVVVTTAVVAIPPARHAVADWLGIGAVEVRRTDRPGAVRPGDHPVPGAPGAPAEADAAAHLAAARRVVQFAIVTPDRAAAGPLLKVEVDRRVPGGLVALSYRRGTVVEIATQGTAMPFTKLLEPDTPLQDVTVNGVAGAWIPETHVIGYVDRAGAYRRDTVRRSGAVLLWQRGAVTYRVEGWPTLEAAQRVAASLG